MGSEMCIRDRCNVNGVIFDEEDLYDNEVSVKSSEIEKKVGLRLLV